MQLTITVYYQHKKTKKKLIPINGVDFKLFFS